MPIYALMSPEMRFTQMVGVGVVVLFAIGFAYRKAQPGKDKGARRDSGIGLPLLGFACGPLVGANLACFAFATGEVHPLDVGHYLSAFLGIGLIAGIIGGAAFGISAWLSRNVGTASKKHSPSDDLEW